MKVKDKVYKFEIEIDFVKSEVRYNRKECEVIGINKDRLVLNDEYFTSMELLKNRYNSHRDILKTVHIYHSKFTFTQHDQLEVSYFSPNNSEKIAKRVMKKQILNYMYEKFGRYTGKEFLLNQI